VPLSDLTSVDLDPVALSNVLDAFGRRRLLSFDREATTGQATVEIAHESLFNEWERLAGWIDRHRAALRRYEALNAAVNEWDSSGRHADYLLTGTRLAEFEAWTSDGALPLGAREREFLAAGLERRNAEEAVERQRAEAALRLERRARMRLLALAAVVVFVVVGTIAAAWAGLFSDPLRVALVHPGIGEVGALAEAGFDRAVSELGLRGEELLLEEGVDNDAVAIREASESGTELVLLTFGMPGIEQVARDHPDVSYVVPFPLEGFPNVSYVLTAENEGSYLAGVAAAEITETGTIGFIGGYDDWYNWTWQAGFEAGARSADPEIEIITSYLRSWPDLPDAGAFANPEGAEAEAGRMFDAGADVILHAAGDSGFGVFEAAAARSTPNRHLWGIGADSDQFLTVDQLSGAVHAEEWKKHILTSVVKRVDVVIYEVVAAFARGELEPGAVTFDLGSGAMDLSYSGGYINDIRAEIEAARADIVSGRTVVPCFPADKLDLAREWQYPSDMCRG
jgi:basic membrane protein A